MKPSKFNRELNKRGYMLESKEPKNNMVTINKIGSNKSIMIEKKSQNIFSSTHLEKFIDAIEEDTKEIDEIFEK